MAFLSDDSEQDTLNNTSNAAAPTANTSSAASTPATSAASPSAQPSPTSNAAQSGAGSSNPNYTQSNYTSGKMILDKNQNSAQPDLTGNFQQKANTALSNLGTA